MVQYSDIGPSTALDHHKCTTSVTENSTHYSCLITSIIVDNLSIGWDNHIHQKNLFALTVCVSVCVKSSCIY